MRRVFTEYNYFCNIKYRLLQTCDTRKFTFFSVIVTTLIQLFEIHVLILFRGCRANLPNDAFDLE